MWRTLRQVMGLGFRLGATVFGGVNVAYPLIRRQAAERGWLCPSEVDALYALSLFAPGPSFLNLWGAVAARVAGPVGALAGQVALLLPAATLVLLVPLLGRVPYLAERAGGATAGAVFATVGLLAASGVQGVQRWRDGWSWLLGSGMVLMALLGFHPTLLLVAGMVAGGLRSRLGAVPARREG